jgi:nicotinamidase-related amidase
MAKPTRALVLVDIQNEYFAGPLQIQYPPVDSSLAHIVAAIDAATKTGTPVVVVQHTAGDEAPVFNPTTDAFALHPDIEQRRETGWHHITKQYSSVFADTDLLEWLHEKSIGTVTLVGYMTNNCIIATAAQAESHGITAEVLSDATGAISISNAAGSVDAKIVHTTLMALLHSNFAAVSTTASWAKALETGEALMKDNLPTSAAAGAQHFARA